MTVTERYVGQVQRALFCTPLHRKKFIRDLEPLAEDFASGNPKAALADFRREFGTPEALAQQYMDTLDDEEVQKVVSPGMFGGCSNYRDCNGDWAGCKVYAGI